MHRKINRGLVAAQQAAAGAGHAEVTPEHLALEVLRQADGMVPQILAGVEPKGKGLADRLEAHDPPAAGGRRQRREALVVPPARRGGECFCSPNA